MNESPPLNVTEHAMGTFEGSPLAYVASLFKTSLSVYPGAVLRITGNSATAGKAQSRLEGELGVSRSKIVVIPDWKNQDGSVNIVIVYMAGHKATRSVWVRFMMDLELPIDVEFEVPHDGAYVNEVKASFDKLMFTIKKQAGSGRFQNIKIGAKVEGLAEFDRETSVKVETKLKAKIQAAIAAQVRVPGSKKRVTVEFFAAAGIKGRNDETNKPYFFEGGATLTIPYDFF